MTIAVFEMGLGLPKLYGYMKGDAWSLPTSAGHSRPFHHSYFCRSLISLLSLPLELEEGDEGWRSSFHFLVLHITKADLRSDKSFSPSSSSSRSDGIDGNDQQKKE